MSSKDSPLKELNSADLLGSLVTTILPGEPISNTVAKVDVGLMAWLQVLASHCVIFNTWGTINSFGIFQPYYLTSLNPPSSNSAISWIGSLQLCLLFLVATISGRLFDAGYLKSTVAVGTLLQVFGLCMTSLGKTYWQILLAQGICVGLGCGLVFAPVVANTSTWFLKKRALAIAAAACGGATGGMVFPVIAQQLLPKVGFAWTLRVMALVVLFMGTVAVILLRTRLQPRTSGPLVELAAFREKPYALFAMAMFFILWALFFAYYYARAYTVTELTSSQTTSFDVLLVLNGIGIPGRILPALAADRWFGSLRVMAPVTFGASILTFAWLGVRSITGMYIWVIFFGFFGASIQSLFPATCASFSSDMSKTGTRIGMVFTIVSIATLTGPPLAGALIQRDEMKYLGADLWGGICLLLGAVLLCFAEIAKKTPSKQLEEVDQ